MQRAEISAETEQPTRINAFRLFLLLLVCLILPVLMGLLLDILLETTPLITLLVGLFSITLAAVVVVRTATREFERIAQQVAPANEEAEEAEEAEDDAATLGTDAGQ